MACEFEVRFPAGQYEQGTECGPGGARSGRGTWRSSCRTSGPPANSAASISWRPRSRSKSNRSCSICSAWRCDSVRGDRRGVRHHVGAALGGMGIRPPGRQHSLRRPTGRGAVAGRRPSGGTRPGAADGPLPQARRANQSRQHRQGIRLGPVCRAAAGRSAWPISCCTAARAACWPEAASQPAPTARLISTPALGDRRPPPLAPRPAAGSRSASRSGVGHLGRPVSVVSPSRTPLRTHPRSAVRPARRGRALDDRRGAPRPPWPMPCRPPSTSWGRSDRWTTAGPIRKSPPS